MGSYKKKEKCKPVQLKFALSMFEGLREGLQKVCVKVCVKVYEKEGLREK